MVYYVLYYLIPVFDEAVPARGQEAARLVGMPQRRDTNTIMRFPLFIKLGCLPIPDIRLAVRVSRHQITITNITRFKFRTPFYSNI